MDNKSGSLTCAAGCWLVAALAGVLAVALLMVLASWSFMQALFIGAVIFLVGGLLISWLICRPLPAPGEAPSPSAQTEKPAAAKPAAPTAAAETAAAAEAPKAEPAAAEVKSSQLPGEDELAARKGEWKYEGDTASAPAAAPAAADGESQPETLSAAREGGADDLKLLKGVGPKLEGTLNELGFFHFDQIAKWTADEVAWVDSRLKFKGRIERDGWIEQAKILAEGGETEFSKRKKT